MTDVLTAAQRQLNMSRIKGKDTKPEMLVRKGLHSCGLRFRLHDRKLPGHPDLVFPRYGAVVFVHGCFWHAHGCALSKLPRTRQDFWEAKLEANAQRDRKATEALLAAGWRVLIVWECALRGPSRIGSRAMVEQAAAFIRIGSAQHQQLAGRETPAKQGRT
jgi:DNA mismatch endonuclease (patch repair protein)